ncbi:hypothetical protein SEA_FORZA_63 [Gordonia phage Forza]|uniref:Uncharacterized protein n=1 Tax=Gordonia phage Forza TaxID=2571247 RepID=A0A650EY23_9CAUD|nr:hypothetical protein PP303_gp063 [Gordonia phage Forza]QEM41533.1 hypothetical protein SEA_BOOPY_64 [Gordonia phage Boopy]QGT55056.1 hypothetical protein SEA_FORZA_63 [Gordonia phage Forza]UXE04206.1 hypothetical protein SEA_BLUENGOLD_62 [Gordonia phage BlueNGold]WBF03845.1 hypothetical protein SEA_MAREELIH_62 [Gordonia phage Mareelih]
MLHVLQVIVLILFLVVAIAVAVVGWITFFQDTKNGN